MDIIGKTEQEAEQTLKRQGQRLRVTQRDGETYLGTCDYWPNRINVVVESGKIIQILGAF